VSGARLGVWPPLPPSAYVRGRRTPAPFPLADERCTLHALGRHGLWQGVRALGLGVGDEALVPAYHHGSEVEALTRAGVSCRFYDVGEALEPVEAELEERITPRTRALLLVHYLGFPQDVDRWRSWCDANGLFLLEDAAQAWLASTNGLPVGSFGDISIFCLYKTFGFPDGGALVSGKPIPLSGNRRGLGLGGLARRHAAWAIGRSAGAARLASRRRRQHHYVPHEDFALGDPSSRPSAATLLLLRRLVAPDAARRRRDNFALLAERLGHLVLRPFDRLPTGSSPFFFPIETDHKRDLIRYLRAVEIDALDFWSVPHPTLPVSRFRRAAALRSRVVGLPVHQELRPRDLERITEAVLAWRPSKS
jgi:dTDP-4-amino-4,6-dideoxygalactose transaminase